MVWCPSCYPVSNNSVNDDNIEIINKTIVYQDTVLNLKDLGENIKVTEFSNLSKDNLESFLNMIFENNGDALFNTIQYSEKQKKIWIYADKKIDTTCWKNKDIHNYTYVDPDNLIDYLKHIMSKSKESKSSLIESSVSLNDKYVSIDMINRLMMKKVNAFYNKEEKLKSKFENKFKKINGEIVSLYISNFDYNNNTLEIEFKPQYSDDYYKIIFGKKNDDLYIAKSSYYDDKNILLNYSDIFSKIYDLYAKNKSYKTEYVDISLGNYIYGTKFLFNTRRSSFNIHLLGDKYIWKSAYKNNYEYEHFNSQKEISFVKENINEIVKNLYFEIDKLPSYMQNMIARERKQEEEKKRDDEVIKREIEKQMLLEERKRLEEIKKSEQKMAKIKSFFKKFVAKKNN